MGVLEDRKAISDALEEAIRLPWQPYLQDPSKGPEQDILFYQSPLLARGVFLSYEAAFNVIMAFHDAGLTDHGSRNVSLMGLGLQDGKPDSHLAASITLRREFAEDPIMRQRIQTNVNLQQAFDIVRKAPVFPDVAAASRHFWEGAPISQVAREIRHAVG